MTGADGTYAHLEQSPPTSIRDHTARWEQLRPIAAVSENVRAEVKQFCKRKRISVGALEALGTRVGYDDRNGWFLAYAGTNSNGQVIAIKYRPLNGTSHDSWAEAPSTWLRPLMIGNRNSLDWVIAEGETDAARLYDLVGNECAILVLPAGARTFKAEWAQFIPRGATIALCHDADADGDAGAEKAAEIIGGDIRRVRPPQDGTDWCDWDGDRIAFLRLAHRRPRYEFVTYAEFVERELPVARPLLGTTEKAFLNAGSLLMPWGAGGCGKSTWTLDGLVHLAAGRDWLGIQVPEPLRVCVIENEGPPSLFQRRLREKVASWNGDGPGENIFVYVNPWGAFTFADPEARATLRDYCDERSIDLITANPMLALGVGMSGKPDETQQFVDWLEECGLWSTRAFWLVHHENKARQISGDWIRHPDTVVHLEREENRQCTRLVWEKTRWASLEPDEMVVLLEWITDGWTYRPVPLEAGVTDNELDGRINAYLADHPASSTRSVLTHVQGTNGRIQERLKAAFQSRPGPRNATFWYPTAPAPSLFED